MSELLAINGGPKAKTTPNYPMYPGGLEIGKEELEQLTEVINNKYLFRYYGPTEAPSKVKAFEEECFMFGIVDQPTIGAVSA